MSKKKETILEAITPMINNFDATHKELDEADREDYVDDLMVMLEAAIKFESGLITEEELEAIHVELEQTVCGRHHVGAAF
jgi:hypothetical protein